LAGVGALAEGARALEDDVGARRAPRKGRGVLRREERDLHAVDDDLLVRDGDAMVPPAVNGVVLEEVGEVAEVGEVVDARDRAAALKNVLEEAAADAAEAVDSDANGSRHGKKPPGPRVRAGPGSS
jgi:hypothetical protein